MALRWVNNGNSERLFLDCDCNHAIKRCLLLGRKAMTNIAIILKSRDIIFLTKVHLVKDGFSSSHVWMWELDYKESWALKNWCFRMWCWRRLLRVPWTARRSNQSILKEIIPGCSLEGLMLKLKLQYFGHLMKELTHWKRPWCWEGLGAGGEGDNRDGWMESPTWFTWVWVNSRSWWWTGRPGVLRFMGSQRVGHTERLNWTELISGEVIVVVVVRSLNRVSLFAIPWTAVCQEPLSSTVSRSLFKFISVEVSDTI